MIVASLLRASLRLINVTNPTAEELSDALDALNIMLSDWSTSRLGIHKLTRANFSTVAGTASYTIGTGGAFNTTRPDKIITAFIRSGITDYEVDIIAAEDYALKSDKSTQSLPCELYHEKGYPLGTVLLYPVPEAVYDLHLYMQTPLASYATTSDDVGLPPEYHSPIKNNLAIVLAPEFGASVTQEVAMLANETLKSLKRLHAAPVPVVNTNPFQQNTTIFRELGI